MTRFLVEINVTIQKGRAFWYARKASKVRHFLLY